MRTLTLFLILMLSAFSLKSETDVKFDLRDPSFGITSTTGRTVIVQAEGRPSSVGNVVLLSYRLSGVTDTNGCITFSNLFGSSISGFYHVTVAAPPLRSDFDIWVQSTNLGLVAASTLRGVFGASTYPASAFAWAADVSDQRYASITNTVGDVDLSFTNTPITATFKTATNKSVLSFDGRATNLLVFSTADTLIGFTANYTNTAFDIDYNLNSPDPIGYVNFVSGARTNNYDFGPGTLSAFHFVWGSTSSSLLDVDGSVTATRYNGSGTNLTGIVKSQSGLATNLTATANASGSGALLLKSDNGTVSIDIITGEMDFNVFSGSITSYNFDQNVDAPSFSGSGAGLTGILTNNISNLGAFVSGAITAGTNGLDSVAARATALTIVSNQSLAVSNAGITSLTIVSNQSLAASNRMVTVTGSLAPANSPVIQNAKFNGTLQLPSGTQLNTDASGTTAGIFWSGTTIQLGSANRLGWDSTAAPDGSGSTVFIGCAGGAVVKIEGNGAIGSLVLGGTVTATNGVTTLATNTLTFTAVSSCTNTLPQGDGTASLSAGTAVVLQDRFGNTVDSIGTIATLHVLIPMRSGMRLSGTGISCVMY